jgi:inhibitor of KinA sporulation pathway (predicted exonuclease)
LTGISQADLKARGRRLGELTSTIKKRFGSASKGWMSWGSDRRAIDADCAEAKIQSPFSNSFHDIGFQFSVLTGANGAVGMTAAMEMFGIAHSGRVHSGRDDAVALAELWTHMARELRGALSNRSEHRFRKTGP